MSVINFSGNYLGQLSELLSTEHSPLLKESSHSEELEAPVRDVESTLQSGLDFDSFLSFGRKITSLRNYLSQ